jgi:acetyl-CoA carboxylase biotin carboxyl carrier protein
MSENLGSAKATDDQDDMAQTDSKKKKVKDASLNMDEIRELADLVDEHGFTDFEFENENIRVRLSKNPPPQVVQAVQPYTNVQNPSPAETQTERNSSEISTEIETKSGDDLYQIPSPIVGTFYRSPAPDKDPYVKEGSNVSPDTIVCIVEAMKLMNEIEAEVSGEVVKIYVEDGQPVEFGQPLFGIRK